MNNKAFWVRKPSKKLIKLIKFICHSFDKDQAITSDKETIVKSLRIGKIEDSFYWVAWASITTFYPKYLEVKEKDITLKMIWEALEIN